MYTRCPECSTIFRVTAAQLRAALGEVSCGSCHQAFNALTALTEELPELTDAVVLEPIATGRDDSSSQDTAPTDEHCIDAEPPAEADGRAPDTPGDLGLGVPTERGDAPLEGGEAAYDDDTGIEPAVDEAEPGDGLLHAGVDAAESAFDAAEEPAESSEFAQRSLDTETADKDEWAHFLSELSPEDDGVTDEDEDFGPVVVLGSADELSAFADREPNAESDARDDDNETVAETSDVFGGDEANLQADPLIDYDPQFVPPWEPESTDYDEDERRARVSKSRVAVVGALVLALGIQLIHYNRDTLAAHSMWGARVRAVYGMLGARLYPDWGLDAYRVSGSEAVAGRTAPAALDILANVVVAGDEEVGMPMIRVALRDRWSNPVASRVFSPAEYLRDFARRPTLLAPGTTLPVEISVADPGTDAHGYVVDICLPHRTAGLQCQLEQDPFRR